MLWVCKEMSMIYQKPGSGSPGSNQPPEPTDASGKISVLIEIKIDGGCTGLDAMQIVRDMTVPGLQLDEEYEPVAMSATDPRTGSAIHTYIVRGLVERQENIALIQARPNVVNIWKDTPIAPMQPQM
jgi:hypothetical protein